MTLSITPGSGPIGRCKNCITYILVILQTSSLYLCSLTTQGVKIDIWHVRQAKILLKCISAKIWPLFLYVIQSAENAEDRTSLEN